MPVSLAVRAATEAAALAFALAALAIAMLYMAVLGVSAGSVVAPAVALGFVAVVTVFLAVLALVRRRFPGKCPVLGAKRGAVIAVLATVVVASAHACFTFGSAGFLYSLLGQVGYACLLGGGPAAVVGALVGRSIERRTFSARRT